jgi:hypothetical protein
MLHSCNNSSSNDLMNATMDRDQRYEILRFLVLTLDDSKRKPLRV